MIDRPNPLIIFAGQVVRFVVPVAAGSGIILLLWFVPAVTILAAIVFVLAGIARMVGRLR